MKNTIKTKNNKKTGFILKASAAAAIMAMVPVMAGCVAGTQTGGEATVSETQAVQTEQTQSSENVMTTPAPENTETSGTEAAVETNAPGTYTQISSDEAAQMMANETDYIILDVRRPDEFASGHIPGAVNVANETISEDSVKDVLKDKSQRIFIYCRSGNRSKQASEKLVNMGYTNIYEFGGINTWKGAVE